MAEIIRMPRLSDTMEEGNLIGWMKKVGDEVSPGDVLAEVETDKATMDLESFHSGTLLYIGVKEGPVPVNGILAIIGNKGDDYKALLASAEAEAENGTKGTSEKEEEKPVEKSAPVTVPEPIIANTDDRIKASPLAKKMATDKGISLDQVQGSGEGGRIIKRDIESYQESGEQVVTLSAVQLDPEVQYGDIPLSQMRKVIARRLSESKFGAPHFYLTMEIDMTNTMSARKAINNGADTRISFNDIIVKASAHSLRKHPNINASWHDDHITVHKEINVGVAVGIPEGLLVPVIRNTDLKSLGMINREVKALAAKARDRKLQPQEMQGNTFTISNLGMFDIDEFTAIINPPDACILAVGSIVQKPVVKNGEIAVGNIMKVTLSCDHRIVDGVKGAEFLQTLKSFLENPVKLLV